ncbi:MAG: TolC family protein [Candidatus Eremiobacteraeota bacterium]|nr:TolC family protein [Candidatus Eremiobacteraeota bacterium]
MSLRLVSTIAALAIAAALPAAASEVDTVNGVIPAPMTLSDAVSYALDHSPSVAQRRAALAVADDNLAKARGNALPNVVGQLQNTSQKSANYGGAYSIIGSKVAQVFSQNTAQIGSNYTLQTGGLAFLALAASRAQDAQAREDLEGAERQLALSVTTAYFTVVQRDSIVALDESDLHYQELLVKVAQAKESAGVAAGVDVLRAEVARAKSASTLTGARADVANATESLAQSAGAPLDARFTFPVQIASPGLPSAPETSLEGAAIGSRAEVRSAKYALDAARLTRKGFDRQLFPQVQIGAALGNQLTPTSVNFLLKPDGTPVIGPGGQPVIAPRVGSPGFWTLSATSTFQLPLVDYGVRHAERASDDAAVASAQNALEAASTQVRADVRQSYRAAQTALAQLSFARDEAKLGAESARVAELQYQHGIIALSDVLQTQQQAVTAQTDFVNARVAYVDAIVKLRVSLGTYDARSAVADLR